MGIYNILVYLSNIFNNIIYIIKILFKGDFMKIGAIYVRKSVQTEKGESIQNQIDICKDYAIKKNISINASLIYCDDGYSGKDFNRPEFQRMIIELKQNKFNVLICYRLDRISRSLNDFSNLSEDLEEHNISFVSVKELFDTSTPIGMSMMYIASVFSQLERETIAERLRDNMSKLSRTGRWLGGVTPTGFKSILTIHIDEDLNKRKMHKLIPINSELDIVKIIFNKFLDLKSLSALEAYCNNSNLKSKNNLPFSKTTLKQILTNPVYCIADERLYNHLNANSFSISNSKKDFNSVSGVLLYNINDEKVISLAKHRGIIESIEWIQIQDILINNKKRPYRQGTSSVGVLSGIIRCSDCGSLMRVKHGRKITNGVSYYYVCTLKEKNKNKCSISNLNGIYIDKIIFKYIQSIHIKSEFLYFLLIYLKLDIIDFKKHKEYKAIGVSVDNSLKLNSLYNSLDILRGQLEVNKDSSSYKYIFNEISSIENKISASTYFNNSTEKSDLIVLESQFYKQILLQFDILSLPFIDKKYLLNKIIEYIIWDDIKLKIHIN